MTYKNYNDYINILKTLAEKVIVTNFDAEDMSHDTSFDIWLEKLDKIKISNFNKLIFVGNGGSAGIASHCATDYTKNGNIRSTSLNDSSMLTCL